MKYLLLIPFITLAQYQPKFMANWTEEQDLTFDYYRGTAVSFVSSEVLNYYTHNSLMSGAIGLGIGVTQGLILERGLDGKVLSCMGAVLGNFIYDIHQKSVRDKFSIDYYDRMITYKKQKKWSFYRNGLINYN